MRRIFVDEIVGERLIMRGDEHKHLFVLRARVGDRLELCCGDGFVNICEIVSIDREQTVVKMIERRVDIAETDIACDLFVGIIKGEHMDIAVQKCVELGVNSINPLITENTVKTDLNVARLQKIALEAAKQCGRGRVPKVNLPQKISDIYNKLSGYDAVVFPYEKAKSPGSPSLFRYLKSLYLSDCDDDGAASFNKTVLSDCDESKRGGKEKIRRIAIVIGPEGGFGVDEAERLSELTTPVTLGVRILRADTACITTTAAVMLVLEQLQ